MIFLQKIINFFFLNFRNEIAELEDEHFPSDWKYGLFRKIVVYIDKYREIGNKKTELKDYNSLNLAEQKVEFYGGINLVNNILCENHMITHVIVPSEDQSRLDQIKKIRRSLPQGKKFRIVSDKWVHDCLKAAKMISEMEYEL